MSLFGHLFADAGKANTGSSLFNPAFHSQTEGAPPALTSGAKKASKKAASAAAASASAKAPPAEEKQDKHKKVEKKEKPKKDKKAAKEASKDADRKAAAEDETPSKKKKKERDAAEAEAPEAKKPRRKQHADSVKLEREQDDEEDNKPRPPKAERRKGLATEVRDEVDKTNRTIFVGNLSVKTTRQDLKKIFAECGAVESTRLRSMPVAVGEEEKDTRRVKVIKGKLDEEADFANGYVVFKSEDAVEAALAMNMREVNGRHLRVDRATTPTQHNKDQRGSTEYDRTRSVFIGNLAYNTTEEDVIRFVLSHARTYDALESAVEAVRLVRDRETNKGKGIGFVLFKSKEAARAALNLNGEKIKERAVRVMRTGAAGATEFNKKGAKKGGKGGKPGVSPKGAPVKHKVKVAPRPKPAAGKGEGAEGKQDWRGTKSKKTNSKELIKKLGVKKGGVKKKGGAGKGMNPAAAAGMMSAPSKGAPGKPRQAGGKNKKRPAVLARKLKAKAGAGVGGGKKSKR